MNSPEVDWRHGTHKSHRATKRITALGYVETGLLLATLASIWTGVLAIATAVILKALE
jgi:hypothetical protein